MKIVISTNERGARVYTLQETKPSGQVFYLAQSTNVNLVIQKQMQLNNLKK
tara:strand:+ start:466 stop:618 length:153 start_codon:yes stop_codon:yes gene_type:complete